MGLAGCETLQGGSSKAKSKDLAGSPAVSASSGMQAVAPSNIPSDKDLFDITNSLSDGSVQVFSLDGPMADTPSMPAGGYAVPSYTSFTSSSSPYGDEVSAVPVPPVAPAPYSAEPLPPGPGLARQPGSVSMAGGGSDTSRAAPPAQPRAVSAPLSSPVAPQPLFKAPPRGIPLATDPRVTVYPLDDNSFGTPVNLAGQQDPSWPNALLPVGPQGDAFAPAPFATGGEEGTEKLSSQEGGQGSPSRIYFSYGSAALDGRDKTVLATVAEQAKFAPVDRVRVEGHASAKTQTSDPVESRILNLKESLNRAYEVSQTLIENGVPAEKIKTVGWGDTASGPQGGEASARRVDIIAGP